MKVMGRKKRKNRQAKKGYLRRERTRFKSKRQGKLPDGTKRGRVKSRERKGEGQSKRE